MDAVAFVSRLPPPWRSWRPAPQVDPAIVDARRACSVLQACSFAGLDVEAHQDTFSVGQIADDLPDRRRQLANKRGQRQNLMIPCEPRILEQVDDLDAIVPV